MTETSQRKMGMVRKMLVSYNENTVMLLMKKHPVTQAGGRPRGKQSLITAGYSFLHSESRLFLYDLCSTSLQCHFCLQLKGKRWGLNHGREFRTFCSIRLGLGNFMNYELSTSFSSAIEYAS